MDTNLIKATLKLKHEEFISGLYHQNTKDLLRNKTFFAGGCIRDLLRDKEPKDFDLYFIDNESRDQFLNIVKTEFQFKATSINNYNSKKTNVQVITVVTGVPESLIGTFDFTINQGYYVPQLDILKLGEETDVLHAGSNIYTPVQALLRCQRFLKQGYKLPAETIINIAVQISQKGPINTEDALKEALMGMSYSEIFDGSPEVYDQVVSTFHADDIPF